MCFVVRGLLRSHFEFVLNMKRLYFRPILQILALIMIHRALPYTQRDVLWGTNNQVDLAGTIPISHNPQRQTCVMFHSSRLKTKKRKILKGSSTKAFSQINAKYPVEESILIEYYFNFGERMIKLHSSMDNLFHSGGEYFY